MSIISFISGLIKPAAELVDSLHTSDEEKGQIINELTRIENEMSSKVLDYEAQLLKSKTKIITVEAQGQSWLQRNWRPLTMVSFLAIIICHYAGFLAFPIADQMWDLLKLGIGGYIAGRTAEKIVPSVIDRFKGKG